MIFLAAWLVFIGLIFVGNAWVWPVTSTRRSWLARYRPFAWLEEVGLDGVRTQARLQRMPAYRVAFTIAGGVFVAAGIIIFLTHAH